MDVQCCLLDAKYLKACWCDVVKLSVWSGLWLSMTKIDLCIHNLWIKIILSWIFYSPLSFCLSYAFFLLLSFLSGDWFIFRFFLDLNLFSLLFLFLCYSYSIFEFSKFASMKISYIFKFYVFWTVMWNAGMLFSFLLVQLIWPLLNCS